MSCKAMTQRGTACKGKVKTDNLCSRHLKSKDAPKKPKTRAVAGGLTIGNIDLFDECVTAKWEAEYDRVMDNKYKKNTRNFRANLPELPSHPSKAIYLIPRVRGGPSYKSVKLEGCDPEHVVYAPISKGFPMQDVSSFTLGPIVGQGLCLVNAAFSKSICVMHMEGGGTLDLKRKSFWKRAKKPLREIVVLDDEHIRVDGGRYNTHEWLETHEALWLDEWEKWRRHVAMASMGSFHWCDESSTIAYRHQGVYLDFVTWKKECYIKPSYDLLPSTKVFQFLKGAYKDGHVLGLVHPMAISDHPEKPITKKLLRDIFDSPAEMCCQPFVVAGKLLGVPIYEE